jgi:hypothetical protein
MERDDWHALAHFLKVSIEAQREVRKAHKAGKEQLSIRRPLIEQFAEAEAEPELFMKLGTFIGSRYPEVER